MKRLMEFALMGFGKVQDTVLADHAQKAMDHFTRKTGRKLPGNGWYVQFVRDIPCCPTCGQPLNP